MFLLTKPTRAEIDSFLEQASTTDLSYPDVGATSNLSSGSSILTAASGYNVDHNELKIGDCEKDFGRAKQAIRDWRMFDFPWVELCWPSILIEEDQNVGILIRHFGFYSLNAARIVYTIDEADWFGFAYGTLADHGESGEERFSVRFDRETGHVIYDLLAFSRPNHLLAHLGYPFTRMLQKQFAEDSKEAMFRAVRTIG
ncbi:MAG: DUF1990 domain-containing protein [bacterium]|nr:DUF1990 domain-containing protein [bacterium]